MYKYKPIFMPKQRYCMGSVFPQNNTIIEENVGNVELADKLSATKDAGADKLFR